MHRILMTFCIVSILACPGCAESFNDPVTSIEVSKDGLFSPGFMYWYSPYCLILSPSELVILGSVTEVTHEPEITDTIDNLRGAVVSGHIQVKAVICCPPDLRKSAVRIKSIECDGFEGLEVGDNILVFMVPYEGHYAVPNRIGTNSHLGYILPEDHDGAFFDPGEFLDLLAGGNAWEITSLTPNQLRTWARVDPHGVAEALIRELEMAE